jgi:hypothetical protein
MERFESKIRDDHHTRNHIRSNKVAAKDKVLVVNEVFCPNGHSLISNSNPVFIGHQVILIGIGVG